MVQMGSSHSADHHQQQIEGKEGARHLLFEVSRQKHRSGNVGLNLQGP